MTATSPLSPIPDECGFTPRPCRPGELLDTTLASGTSPWFWLTAVTVGLITALAVAALVVFVVTRHSDEVAERRWRQQFADERTARREKEARAAFRLREDAAKIAKSTDGEFTITPANDTDDLPPAPVNLDEER